MSRCLVSFPTFITWVFPYTCIKHVLDLLLLHIKIFKSVFQGVPRCANLAKKNWLTTNHVTIYYMYFIIQDSNFFISLEKRVPYIYIPFSKLMYFLRISEAIFAMNEILHLVFGWDCLKENLFGIGFRSNVFRAPTMKASKQSWMIAEWALRTNIRY